MSIISLSDFKGRGRIANVYGVDSELPVVDIAKAVLDVKLIKGIITHEQHFLAKIELQDIITKAEFSGKERKKLAKEGEAESDGSYPIENESDLHNAIQAFGRSKNKVKTKAWIKKRAKDLGCENCLPDSWKLKKIEKAEDAQLIIKDIEELIKGGEGSRGGEIIGHTRSGKPIYKSGKHSDYKNFHEYDHEEAGHHHAQLADLHRQKSNAHGSLAKMAEYEKDKEGAKHYNNEKAESDKKEIHHAAQSQYHYEEARPQAHRDRVNKIGQMVADIRKK